MKSIGQTLTALPFVGKPKAQPAFALGINVSHSAPAPAGHFVSTLTQDTVSVRFGVAPAKTSAAAPFLGAPPTSEAGFFTELMRNQNIAGRPDEDWPFAYALYLLRQDESVRKYVKDQYLEPDELVKKLQPTVKKLLEKSGNTRSTISDAKHEEILTQSGGYARTQNNAKEMTTLHFWRWMMSKEPSEYLQGIFKQAGLNDQQIDTLKKAPASVELPPLGQDSALMMGNFRKLNIPYPADVNWPMFLLQNLLSDSSVKQYLDENQINASDFYIGVQSLEASLANMAKRSSGGAREFGTLSNEKIAEVITSVKRFALNEGATMVTPVLLWRWVMTQDPEKSLNSSLKIAFPNSTPQTIEKYRSAPPQALKKVSAQQARPTKADIAALNNALDQVPKVVIGQDEPLRLMLKDIKRTTLGYASESNPDKPRAVVLMLGPSGVGKTYSAQKIAKAMGRELIQISMNEFKDAQNKAKLTGAAPGYTGFGEAETLADKIIKANQSTAKHGTPPPIVLFDEIEKAHPEVFDVIMQIFDQGKLQNGKGETASFAGSYILLTSNIGQRQIAKAKEKKFDEEKIQGLVKAILEGDKEKTREILGEDVEQDVNMGEYQQFAGFRPEFIGRINSFAIFETLTKDNTGKILDLAVGEIKKSAKTMDNYDLEITPALRQFILDKGYSIKTGAREVKNEMEKTLHNALVDKREELILEDKLNENGGKLVADLEALPNNKGKVKLTYTPNPPSLQTASNGPFATIQATIQPPTGGPKKPDNNGGNDDPLKF